MKNISVVFDEETWDEIEAVKARRRTKNTSQVIREAIHAYILFLLENTDAAVNGKLLQTKSKGEQK